MRLRSSVVLLAAVLVGGGVLAWFALRERGAHGPGPDVPQFVVKATGGGRAIERIDEAVVEPVDASGRPTGDPAAVVRRVPAGAREASAPLMSDVARFRIRFRLADGGEAGAWHEMGPYEAAGTATGSRVLQIGLVLEEQVDLDAAGTGLEPAPGFIARVTVRAREPHGAESFQTFGALPLPPSR